MFLKEHPFWVGGGLVWYDPMSIHFSKASIPPSIRSSIHTFLQIILGLNLSYGMELNLFRPPISSDDLCLLFCLILFRWLLSHKHSHISDCTPWVPTTVSEIYLNSRILCRMSVILNQNFEPWLQSLWGQMTHTFWKLHRWVNSSARKGKLVHLSPMATVQCTLN